MFGVSGPTRYSGWSFIHNFSRFTCCYLLIAFSFVTSAAGGRRRVSGDYGSISGGDARGSKFSLAMNQLFAEHKPDIDMDFLQSRRQSVIIGDPVKRPIIG